MTQPLKWHGGKFYLAPSIIGLMPRHLHYVEPYFGGGAVLFQKIPQGSEVINDLNGELMNFWTVLKDPKRFTELQRLLSVTPFSEPLWRESLKVCPKDSSIERALKMFIRCRQSLAGRQKTFAPLSRTRLRRGINEQVSAWLGAIDGLPEAHRRLVQVVVLNRPALEVILSQDGPQTFFYLDPPYLPETRTAAQVYGTYEMTTEGHLELLRLIRQVKGKVLLSGYPSTLYEENLRDWNRKDFDLPNNASGGGTKRRMIERIWMNY